MSSLHGWLKCLSLAKDPDQKGYNRLRKSSDSCGPAVTWKLKKAAF